LPHTVFYKRPRETTHKVKPVYRLYKLL